VATAVRCRWRCYRHSYQLSPRHPRVMQPDHSGKRLSPGRPATRCPGTLGTRGRARPRPGAASSATARARAVPRRSRPLRSSPSRDRPVDCRSDTSRRGARSPATGIGRIQDTTAPAYSSTRRGARRSGALFVKWKCSRRTEPDRPPQERRRTRSLMGVGPKSKASRMRRSRYRR